LCVPIATCLPPGWGCAPSRSAPTRHLLRDGCWRRRLWSSSERCMGVQAMARAPVAERASTQVSAPEDAAQDIDRVRHLLFLLLLRRRGSRPVTATAAAPGDASPVAFRPCPCQHRVGHALHAQLDGPLWLPGDFRVGRPWRMREVELGSRTRSCATLAPPPCAKDALRHRAARDTRFKQHLFLQPAVDRRIGLVIE